MNAFLKSLKYSLIAFGIIFSSNIFAHAVVTKTSLTIAPIQANTATQVKLNFNSTIELGLSQFFLVRKGDQQDQLSAALGDQPGLVSIDIPALSSGEYALRVKVFAADGHLTEDIIRFMVK